MSSLAKTLGATLLTSLPTPIFQWLIVGDLEFNAGFDLQTDPDIGRHTETDTRRRTPINTLPIDATSALNLNDLDFKALRERSGLPEAPKALADIEELLLSPATIELGTKFDSIMESWRANYIATAQSTASATPTADISVAPSAQNGIA